MGIDIYNLEAEAYGAKVEECEGDAIPGIRQPLWTVLDDGLAPRLLTRTATAASPCSSASAGG